MQYLQSTDLYATFHDSIAIGVTVIASHTFSLKFHFIECNIRSYVGYTINLNFYKRTPVNVS